MQTLNLKQLEAFCAVVERGSFTAAAEALGVSDGGGPLAEQAQHHQHGAKVRAVGKVDVGAVQGGFFEPDALIGGGQLCPAAAQDAEDGRITL